MKLGFGVDIGGTAIKLACFNREGTLLDKWEIPTRTSNDGRKILPDFAESLLRYMEEKKIPREGILGIGLGVPGAVLPDGTVNRCVNLGWGVCNPEKQLQSLTGFPVKAGNDASVAALGEYWKSGGTYRSMVFVTFGTGVGGGIVLDGKLLFGVHGAAGEIGHIVLKPWETEACNCGKRGCAEQYCSATGIVRQAEKYLLQTKIPSALSLLEQITCKAVFDAAKAGDRAAQEILEQVYDDMAQFLANICNVLDPEAVVLGGGVSKAGQPLLEGIGRYFGNYVFHAVTPVHFSLANLGNDAGVYGAFRLLINKE